MSRNVSVVMDALFPLGKLRITSSIVGQFRSVVLCEVLNEGTPSFAREQAIDSSSPLPSQSLEFVRTGLATVASSVQA